MSTLNRNIIFSCPVETVILSLGSVITSVVKYRESILKNAVFVESICMNTNFKMADLRGASFDRANLNSVNFDHAKVHSVSIKEVTIKNILECTVDVSLDGDGSQLVSVSEWIEREQN